MNQDNATIQPLRPTQYPTLRRQDAKFLFGHPRSVLPHAKTQRREGFIWASAFGFAPFYNYQTDKQMPSNH